MSVLPQPKRRTRTHFIFATLCVLAAPSCLAVGSSASRSSAPAAFVVVLPVAPAQDGTAQDSLPAAKVTDVEHEKQVSEAEGVEGITGVAEESEVLEQRRAGTKDGLVPRAKRWRGAKLYWDQGPRIDALDGNMTMIFGGRLHLDAAGFDEDAGITQSFGEPDPGFLVRRAYLELGALAYERVESRFMVNFAQTVDFRDVFVGVLGLPLVGDVRMGYFKEPFGLEEIESSNDISFMERSLTNAMVPRRNLGVMLHRRVGAERRASLWLGAFRDADNDLTVSDGHGITGRLTGVPFRTDDGRQLIHVGLAATYREPSNGTLRFQAQPESVQAQVLADTGDFAAVRDLRIGAEFATVLGPLSFQTEAMLAAVEGGPGVGDPLFPSAYAMASYVLTGEHRLYRKTAGAFGRIKPESSWGALELTGRYSFIDLDSAGITGGRLQDVTVGLNWYVTFHSRLMLNYIAARPDGFGVEQILQLRWQLNF